MNFNKIELSGFKSFADRTEIKFDNGITAIVGPNGCGKSNVSDAIRWVLGEQSSKLLRGTSMQDVIFNGTEKRKSLSYCEVTLIFNNTDRYFNYDNDEIAITRKLYRSGESAYLINRTPVRLKDIVNLLYDSGIGRDGYSIIGQGKVEEIISSKPENRRTIFEDAAGIAKFKSRKVDAERKLERTRENLQRANDILAELERQMGPLKKQAENAKLWLEYRNRLQDLEVNAYVFKYNNANTVKQQINNKLNSICDEIANRQQELTITSNKYDDSMAKVGNIDTTIAESHEEILNLTVEIEKQSGEANVIRERIANMTETKSKISLDLLNNKNLIEKNSAELNFKKQKYDETVDNLHKLNLAYDEMSNEYLAIIDELSLHEDQTQDSQQKMFDAINKLTDIKANFSKYQAEREMLLNSVSEIEQRLKNINVTIKDKQQTKQKLLEIAKKLEEEKLQSQENLNSAKLKQDSLTLKIKETQEERYRTNSKIQVYENRKSMLEEMQKEYDGYQYAVKKLLKESERNQTIKNKMLGVLASLINVPEKYETAIEIALGNAVQNIVTYDEQNAKDLIYFLKTNQFGRATFLPITKIKPKSILQEDKKALLYEGCYGIASDLISCKSEIKDIISNLLGMTIIVDNLDNAINISNSTKLSYKIVTLDGDVINPQGSMTGGSKKNEVANLISRDREINTLTQELDKLKRDFNDKTTSISNMQKELDSLKFNMNKLFDLKNGAEINYAKESEKLNAFETSLDEIIEEKTQLETQKNNTLIKVNVITKELESIDELENMAMQNKTSANKFIKERQQKFVQLKEKRDELNEQITKVKVEIASLEAQKTSFEQEFERLNQEIKVATLLKTSNEQELSKIEKTIFEAENIIKQQIETQANEESKNKLNKLRLKMQEFETEKQKLQEDIKFLNERKMSIMSEITKLNDKKITSENQLEKVDIEIEQMQERIYEEYSLTYSSCQEYVRADFKIDEALVEINNIKKEISKLGYVNVHAIEDVKLLMERYDGLKEQTDDLTKAEDNLTKVIEELSVEMKDRFEKEFNKINENFKITFKELFGGGNARLELTDPTNLLESGVDIVAEPPGKKLQNITLLSGGEKALTAIAILFAILKLRPMPFCLLDEIEAALDDSNVGRFAEYLRKFSKVTQFIVITHRKPTMELADCLYGVTMEEKGVSKIVSVQLSDALKNVAEGDNGNI